MRGASGCYPELSDHQKEYYERVASSNIQSGWESLGEKRREAIQKQRVLEEAMGQKKSPTREENRKRKAMEKKEDTEKEGELGKDDYDAGRVAETEDEDRNVDGNTQNGQAAPGEGEVGQTQGHWDSGLVIVEE